MNNNKLKLLDCLMVWGICFLLFGIVGELLSAYVGIWAFYLCQVLSVAVVLIVAKKTGLSMKRLLAPGGQSVGLIAGSALIWVGCLLLVIPCFLFSHLLTPAMTLTTFHVYDYTSSHIAVAGLILVAGVAESILFDGFLYSRMKGIGKVRAWVPFVFLGIAGGLYHPDLYILLPMAILSVGFAYVRSRTDGFALPLILRTLTILMALAFMQVSGASTALPGSSMGIVQVIGFTLIFFGAALPAIACGARLLGHLKDRSMFEKCMVIAVSVVLIASGCGISTF